MYESPYRIQQTIAHLQTVLGSQRPIVLARELTKIHEAFLRGSLAEVQAYFHDHAPRGEYVLLVAGKSGPAVVTWSASQVLAQVHTEIAAGTKPNTAIKQVAKQADWSRQAVYNLYHGLEAKE